MVLWIMFPFPPKWQKIIRTSVHCTVYTMVGDSQTLLVFQSLPAMNRALRGHRTWTLFSTTTILICLHAFDPYFSRNTCMTSPPKMNVHEDVKTLVFLCFPRQNPRFSCRCSVVPMISPRRSLGGVSFEEGIS